MHSKKNRLQIDYPYDFSLYGLLSGEKEYKLAWRLNDLLDICFAKSDNLKLKLRNGQDVEISNFIEKREHCTFLLLKNRVLSESLQNKFLIESHKHLDYFIIVKDKNNLIDSNELLSKLKDSPHIQMTSVLDVDRLPNKENLIF